MKGNVILLVVFSAAALLPLFGERGDSGGDLSGRIEVVDFMVPSGTTVFVAEDLEISATRNIEIRGQLIGRKRQQDDVGMNGPDITLRAGRGVYVTGAVLGGRGQDVVPGGRSNAGRGSNITIEAIVTVVDGKIRAGDGGTALPGGHGGNGGEVVIIGDGVSSYSDDPERMVFGGDGGFPGGNGGNALVYAPDLSTANYERQYLPTRIYYEFRGDGRQEELAGDQASHEESMVVVGIRYPIIVDCPAGEDMPGGTNVEGGGGGEGIAGNNGTLQSPQGQTGQRGGDGGDVQGGNGAVGGNGASCCPDTGGRGGKGGNSGVGTGGIGGPGGTGGNGYFDTNLQAYTGPGGDGGPGGPGGDGSCQRF